MTHIIHHVVGYFSLVFRHLEVKCWLRHVEGIFVGGREDDAVLFARLDSPKPTQVHNESSIDVGCYFSIGKCIPVNLTVPRSVVRNRDPALHNKVIKHFARLNY